MGQWLGSIIIGPLPDRGEIYAKELADAALGLKYLAIDPVGWQIDELGGQIGQQRLETQPHVRLFEWNL
ncbi:MAG: hypothetical protein AB2L14_25760 [Candidatus Xenobiia bacterium LiM19]